MVKKIYSLFLLLLCIKATSQHIQYGQVTAYRKEGAPLANVQITAVGAVPTTTDVNGLFRLHFNTKYPGDQLDLLTVEKAGYEWVNREQLEYAKLSKNIHDTIKIVMARAGEVQQVKLKYYNIFGFVLQKRYDSLAAELKQARLNNQITQQQLEQELTSLRVRLQNCLQQKDELAEFAARYYSSGNETADQLLALLETGEIDRAVQILDIPSIFETANRLLLARQKIAPGHDADSLAVLINRHVQLMTLAAKIYTLHLDTRTVELLYAKILQLQPNNLEMLKEISVYYRTTGRYRDALQLLGRLRQLQPDMRLRARTLSLAGHVYHNMGMKDSTQYFYTRYQNEVQLLAQANTGDIKYLQELAMAEKNLGAWFLHSHQVKAAIQHFQAAEQITGTTSKSADKSDTAWAEHVNSLSTLGSAWSLLYRYDSAAACFNKGRQILEPLYSSIAQQPYIEPRLASIYFLLGDVFYKKSDDANANSYLQKALDLNEKQLMKYPGQELPVQQLAATCQQLANSLSRSKEYSAADTMYLRADSLLKALCYKNPVNVLCKYTWSVVCGDAALHYYRNKRYKPGLKEANKCYALAGELHRQYPQAPEYGYLYARTLYILALLQKKTNERKKAKANLYEAIGLLQSVLQQNPGDYLAMAQLGECYWQLGIHRFFFLYSRRQALLYRQAAEQFYPLCSETGYSYFCRMLNAARRQANTAWPFRLK